MTYITAYQLLIILKQGLNQVNILKPYTFHIDLYDLAFLAMISVEITFSLMLLLAPKDNKTANRILGLIQLISILAMIRALNAHIHLENSKPSCTCY